MPGISDYVMNVETFLEQVRKLLPAPAHDRLDDVVAGQVVQDSMTGVTSIEIEKSNGVKLAWKVGLGDKEAKLMSMTVGEVPIPDGAFGPSTKGAMVGVDVSTLNDPLEKWRVDYLPFEPEPEPACKFGGAPGECRCQQ